MESIEICVKITVLTPTMKNFNFNINSHTFLIRSQISFFYLENFKLPHSKQCNLSLKCKATQCHVFSVYTEYFANIPILNKQRSCVGHILHYNL